MESEYIDLGNGNVVHKDEILGLKVWENKYFMTCGYDLPYNSLNLSVITRERDYPVDFDTYEKVRLMLAERKTSYSDKLKELAAKVGESVEEVESVRAVYDGTPYNGEPPLDLLERIVHFCQRIRKGTEKLVEACVRYDREREEANKRIKGLLSG